MQKTSHEYCELCGAPLHGRGITVSYEGSILTVCNSCYQRIKRYAKMVNEKEIIKSPFLNQKKTRIQQSNPVNTPKPQISGIPEYEVVDDYAQIIRSAREEQGLSQKQLAEKIKVSENLIKKFESGKLKPTIEQAKMLEKALKIKLLVKVQDNISEEKKNTENFELTLGDIVHIREGRK